MRGIVWLPSEGEIGGRMPLADVAEQPADRTEDVLAVDESLKKLACADPRRGCLVELHFFGGLTNEEAAAVLGISERTCQPRRVARTAGPVGATDVKPSSRFC